MRIHLRSGLRQLVKLLFQQKILARSDIREAGKAPPKAGVTLTWLGPWPSHAVHGYAQYCTPESTDCNAGHFGRCFIHIKEEAAFFGSGLVGVRRTSSRKGALKVPETRYLEVVNRLELSLGGRSQCMNDYAPDLSWCGTFRAKHFALPPALMNSLNGVSWTENPSFSNLDRTSGQPSFMTMLLPTTMALQANLLASDSGTAIRVGI